MASHQLNLKNSLLKNAAIYSMANVLTSIIPFILLPILTRVLLPSEYGILAMFNLMLGALGSFIGLNSNGALIVRFVDRDEIDYPRYVSSCFYVLILSVCMVFTIIFVFYEQLSLLTAIPPFWLLTSTFVAGGNFLIQIRLAIWLMAKRPVNYGLFQLSLGALNTGLSLLFVLLLKWGYDGRLWGQTLAVSTFAFLSFFSLTCGGWLKFKPSWTYVKEVLAFGIPLVPHSLGIFLISAADRFIINMQLGLEAAGIYMVAVQIGMGIGLFAESFNNAFVPWLFEQLKADIQEKKYYIVKGTWIYFTIALSIASIVALLSHWIVILISGPEYIGAANALVWISFGQALFGMYLMVTNYIFFKRKTLLLPWLTILSGVLGLTLTWFLIPEFGIAGAGISYSVAMGLRFLLTWLLSQKVCPMPWFSFQK